MLDRIKLVFASVFDESIKDDITETATMDSVAVWDSLSFIRIMLAIESEFGISIEPDDAHELTSIEGITALVARKGA